MVVESSTPNERSLAESAVHAAFRRVGSQSTWHAAAVADAAGIHRTDLEFLDLLDQEPLTTASRLAELSGLTNGAVTGVLDRLERAGLVARERDTEDRRRVYVRKAAGAEAIDVLYGPLSESLHAVLADFDDAELETLARYAEVASSAMQLDTARLRLIGAAEQTANGGGVGLATARLEVLRGLSKATVRLDPGLGSLYEARFRGARPTINERDGVIRLAYRRPVFGAFNLGADISLQREPVWTMDIEGGASHVTFDLSGGRFDRLSITGGVHQCEITVPAPVTEQHIEITGGVSRLRVRVPAHSGVEARIGRGVHRFEFDGRRHTAGGGIVERREGAGLTRVTVHGGAHHLSIGW